MFLALAASNADCLVGAPQGGLGQHAWLRVYRGMDHRDARSYLNQDRQLFSAPVPRLSTHLENFRTPDIRPTITPAE